MTIFCGTMWLVIRQRPSAVEVYPHQEIRHSSLNATIVFNFSCSCSCSYSKGAAVTKRILDAARLDVYLHDVEFERVSESPVRHAAEFDYEHRYAEHEHEHEHENASKGGIFVD